MKLRNLLASLAPAFLACAGDPPRPEESASGSHAPPAAAPRETTGVADAARETPRLVVLFVVDQLGTEVLASAWPALGDAGFARLAREGAVYWRTRYDHAATETGPGHATIATGAAPRSHGIVANKWPSCDGRSSVFTYCTDAKPSAGSDGKGSPENLCRPTLATAMERTFGPASRVVSVSLKDRAAVLMAGRGDHDLVAWYDSKKGELELRGADAGAREAFRKHLGLDGTAEGYRGRPWTLLDRSFGVDPERDPNADLGRDDDPLEAELFGSRVFPRAFSGDAAQFSKALPASPFGNDLVLAAAEAAIETFELGADETPDLLCISFSSNDYVGHECGPRSWEVRDMTRRTDLALARLLRRLDLERGLAGRYCVVATADHGAGPLLPPLARADGAQRSRKIAEAELVAHVERALGERFGERKRGPWVRASTSEVLALDHAAIESASVDVAAASDAVVEALDAYPGILRAYAVARVNEASAARDPIEAAVWRSLMPPRSGDVYLVVEPHFGFDSEKRPTTHGAPWIYDQEVPLFLFGPGIKRGWSGPAAASPASGVVTIARLLGVEGLEPDYPALIDALE